MTVKELFAKIITANKERKIFDENIKKLLSVLLAVMFVLSSFAAGFSVSASEDRSPIHRVDITLRTDLAGKPFWDRSQTAQACMSTAVSVRLNMTSLSDFSQELL